MRMIHRGDGASSSDELPKRQPVGWLVEEGGQAVVTAMAQHVEVPPRRYPRGRPESKYIESPDSSACSLAVDVNVQPALERVDELHARVRVQPDVVARTGRNSAVHRGWSPRPLGDRERPAGPTTIADVEDGGVPLHQDPNV